MTPRFFTRCHSGTSVHPFRSRKRAVGEKLSMDELLAEFQKHRFLNNEEPTKLVSVSSRLINTLSRALVKWCGKNENGYRGEAEPADEIFITFIDIPAPDSGLYHHAEALAKQLGDRREAWRYASEYVFEGEIPPEYIRHTVSLQTLIDRGLGLERYIGNDGIAPSTNTLKYLMATEYLDDSTWQYEIGLNIGFMARCFGAQAPVLDIAKQFIDDCTVELCIDKQDYYIYAHFGSKESRKQCLDLGDPSLREDGIYTAIVEWWLCDETFMQKYDQYREWVSIMEDCMLEDYISFYGDICDRMYSDSFERDLKLQAIKANHERINADIERAAVELGL